MDTAARSTTAAAFAATIAAAGAIAASVTAPTANIPTAQTHPVHLVADDSLWDAVLQTAQANATAIYDHFSPAAFADVQQFAANVPAYLTGARNFDTDLGLAYNAATNPFMPTDPEPYIYTSVDTAKGSLTVDTPLGDIPTSLPGKDELIGVLTNGLPYSIGECPVCLSGHFDILSLLVGSQTASEISPYLEFTGSPLSGILWGEFGSMVGPLVQLHDDFAAITAALSGATPDYTAALNDLGDLSANVTNAYLNGYGEIGLSTLLADFGVSAPLGVDVNAIQLDLGGLLSPGGSLIDGIGLTGSIGTCSVLCATLDVPSTAVGPIASLFEQDQAIAEAIGWDGVGQPLAHLISALTGMVS